MAPRFTAQARPTRSRVSHDQLKSCAVAHIWSLAQRSVNSAIQLPESLSGAQTTDLPRTALTWPPPWTRTTPWGRPSHRPTCLACRTYSAPTKQLPLGSCLRATILLPSVMTGAAPRVLHICCTLPGGQTPGNWVPNLKDSSTRSRKHGLGSLDASARMRPKKSKEPIEPSIGWRRNSPP